MHSIYLTPKDLQKLVGCNTCETARKYKNELLIRVGKQPGQKLTVWDFCKAEDMTIDELEESLSRLEKSSK